MNRIAFAGITLLSLVVGSITWGDRPVVIDTLHVHVVGAIDGDTLTVHIDGKPATVRLEGLDAPEFDQKFGKESKQALQKFVASKEVIVQKTGIDKEKRLIGTVLIGDIDVCAKMIEDGWAWHFKQQNSDEQLAKLEQEARLAQRGIWQLPYPTSPWEFRTQKKQETAEALLQHGRDSVASTPTTAKPASPPVAVVPPVSTSGPDSNSGGPGMVWVNGYTRKNGTHVKGYWRRK